MYTSILFQTGFRVGLVLSLVVAGIGGPPTMAMSPQVINVKLSDIQALGGSVQSMKISPDSSRVVYLADHDTDGVIELYSVSVTGGAPTRLNNTPAPGGKVESFEISADSSRVVYVAYYNNGTADALYSVPIEGSAAPVKLSGAHSDFYVLRYYLSADSNRVVYTVNQDADDMWELYSVPIDGSAAPQNLSNELSFADHTLGYFQISADSSRVVYFSDPGAGEISELYSVPIAGGTPIRLNGALATDGNVWAFGISADGSQVVYIADQDTHEVYELYSVPTDGSAAPVKLSDAPGDDGNVLPYFSAFQISADSSRVVYFSDRDTNNEWELYSVPIAGGALTKINGTLVDDGSVKYDFQISAGSNRVVYRADQDTDGVSELYSVPIDGSAVPVKLNGALVAGGDVERFAISADNSRVIYRADQDTDDVLELYSAPMDGSAVPVKLNGALVAGGEVWWDFKISADSSRVVYRADLNTDEVAEIYSVPLDGGAPVRLNAALASGRNVDDFEMTGDSNRVVYIANQDRDWAVELYSVPPDGSAAPLKLNGALPIGGDVDHFKVSPDGNRVVYCADQDTDEVYELYSAPIDGSAAPLKLNPTLPYSSGASWWDFAISADSSRVVYCADQDTYGVYELYSVPIGGGAPLKLNAALGDDGDVWFYSGFQISADGSRVVYLADQDTDGIYELYSVPIDGSAAPVKLSGALDDYSSVDSFEISADGSRVVYIVSLDTYGAYELYSAPIDGSAAPVKLNGALAAGGTVSDGEFQIGADSSRVVYIADLDADEVWELYSAPIGGGAPVMLNGALGIGNDQYLYDIFLTNANSSRVVYRSDQDTDGVCELYSIPIDGGAAPVKFDGMLVAGEEAWGFELSPDGSRVIYRVAQATDDTVDLYSAPIAGGAPVKLNDMLSAGGYVDTRFWISADSSRVVYSVYQATNDGFELYSVPLAGGAPVKINGALPAGDSVEDFEISADSSRVVYGVYHTTDNVSDIYSAPIDGGTPVKINGTLPAGGGVDTRHFPVSTDTGWVVYIADQEVYNVRELYASLDAAPEISVQSNGRRITAGDTTPSTADGTWFISEGVGDTVVHIFTIYNTGAADLALIGAPAVILDVGTHFNATVQPSSIVISHSVTSFEIAFNPASTGIFTDTVSITNNDADETPFTFVILGMTARPVYLPLVMRGQGK